jgi:threonine aldolase
LIKRESLINTYRHGKLYNREQLDALLAKAHERKLQLDKEGK